VTRTRLDSRPPAVLPAFVNAVQCFEVRANGPLFRVWIIPSICPVHFTALFLLLALCLEARAEPEDETRAPPRIMVTCGEVGLLVRQASQWTPGRIDFRGMPLTTEKSAYGTVFLFPEIGFIGTAHLENEPESDLSVEFFLDGKAVTRPPAFLNGERFRLERRSRIRSFVLEGTFEVHENRIWEAVTIHAQRDTPLKLVYHFMHAWKPGVSTYLAGKDADPDESIDGALSRDERDDKRFVIGEEVDWVAVYAPEDRVVAVSRLVARPAGAASISQIWNVPGRYQKYYLKSLVNETVPTGFSGTWKMVTGFIEGEEGTWRESARRLASELKQAPPPG